MHSAAFEHHPSTYPVAVPSVSAAGLYPGYCSYLFACLYPCSGLYSDYLFYCLYSGPVYPYPAAFSAALNGLDATAPARPVATAPFKNPRRPNFISDLRLFIYLSPLA